jgi:hypothetical protein
MSDNLSREEIHEAADHLVMAFLDEAGVDAAPVDALRQRAALGAAGGGGRRRGW